MEKVSGIVQGVILHPGRADIVQVMFEKETDVAHPLEALHGNVTCDGTKVTAAELFAWLIEHGYPVDAVLHQDPRRYGTAMKAEFTSGPPT